MLYFSARVCFVLATVSSPTYHSRAASRIAGMASDVKPKPMGPGSSRIQSAGLMDKSGKPVSR